jgi:hypothetical protein
MFFFIGEILPNFYLKNLILTYTKDLSWKTWTELAKSFKDFFPPKSPDFYDKFQ